MAQPLNPEVDKTAVDFVERLHLSGDPFAPHFSGDYFFPGARRRHCLDQVIHFCRFSPQVVALTGLPGSGKTTLVDAVVSQLQAVMDCCRVTAEQLSTPDALLFALAEHFKLTLSEQPTVDEFVTVLKATAFSGEDAEPVLVIVEQGQNLEPGAVQLLKEIQGLAEEFVHLLLVGERHLLVLMAAAGLDIEQLQLFELELFSHADVSDYVQGRLNAVGYLGNPVLTSDQIAVLSEQSQGSITRLHRLVPTLLNAVDTESLPPRFGTNLPLAHLAAIVALVLVLLGSLLLSNDEEQDLGQESSVDRSIVSLPVELSLIQNRPKAENEASSDADEGLGKAVVPPKLVKSEDNAAELREPTGVSFGEPSQPVPATEADFEETVVEVKEPAPPVPAPVLPPQKENDVVPVPPREQRLLGMPGSAYMLQLLGSHNEHSARGVVRDYIGRLPLTYFQTRLNKKAWFVVVTGPYDSKEKAHAAVPHLPEALRKQKPWARSVASIQNDIRAKN